MIKVSSPGKLMLFGEHAAVYGKPCIVTAVNYRISVSLEENPYKIIILNAPDVHILEYKVKLENLGKEHPKGAKFILKALENFFNQFHVRRGLSIHSESEFSGLSGFGSSSSVTVSTIKALSEIIGIKMTKRDIFDLSYKTVMDIQGHGSGFDVVAALWGGTLYYIKPGKIIEKLKIDQIPLIVGYTGIKADTGTLVKRAKKKMIENPAKITHIYNEIEEIVNLTKPLFKAKEWKKIGEYMDMNQKALRALNVSTKELENLIDSAKNAGAYGAKLSGAGGGDCMIAIGNPLKIKKIEEAVEDAGGKVIKVKTNAKGVRVEE